MAGTHWMMQREGDDCEHWPTGLRWADEEGAVSALRTTAWQQTTQQKEAPPPPPSSASYVSLYTQANTSSTICLKQEKGGFARMEGTRGDKRWFTRARRGRAR